MLSIDIAGLPDLDARLAAYAGQLVSSLDKTANRLVQSLLDKVRSDKLSGGSVNSRTGALAASISADVATSTDGVTARLTSAGVAYAAIQEFGGKTSAHEITPSKAQAMAFVTGGDLRFARRVRHPGSTIPERSFLRSSLAELAPDIESQFAASAEGAWRNT